MHGVVFLLLLLFIVIVVILPGWIMALQRGIADGKILFSGEYCLMEAFIANCPARGNLQTDSPGGSTTPSSSRGQTFLVVMHKARYGRMKEGRCMRKNYDEKGCNTDVLDIMDKKCSGRSSCNITLPDPDLFETRPCPEDLNPYLEVSYFCVPVNFLDEDTCLSSGHVLLTSSEGYLAGHSELFPHFHYQQRSNENGEVRSPYCSFVIEVLPGQRVNLTVLNFARETAAKHGNQLQDKNKQHYYYHHQPQSLSSSSSASYSSSSSSSSSSHHHYNHHRNRHHNFKTQMAEICSNVAVVYEDLDGSEVMGRGFKLPSIMSATISTCSGDEREKLVHSTRGHRVRIDLPMGNNLKQANFLIRYHATGCASVLRQASDDTWFRREGGVMKVGCNSTNEIWYLACKDGDWVGTVGNCSTARDASESGWRLQHMLNMEDSLPFGMLLVVAMGVAIGVIIGSVLLCTIAMVTKRHRRLLVKHGHHHQHHRQQQQQQPPQPMNATEEQQETFCFYQDQLQSSIPLQHNLPQQYYQRCHHHSDTTDCRCYSQRETASLLIEGVHCQGIEESLGDRNPSTPMVVRDAVKASNGQSKETIIEDTDVCSSQKSTHSAYQYHQLMLASVRHKNSDDKSLLKPKQHAAADDLLRLQSLPQAPCTELLCSSLTTHTTTPDAQQNLHRQIYDYARS